MSYPDRMEPKAFQEALNEVLAKVGVDIEDEPYRKAEESLAAKREEERVDAAIHEHVQVERLALSLEKLLEEGLITPETSVAHLLFLLQKKRSGFLKEGDEGNASERSVG